MGTLASTFNGASKFSGTGLSSWDTASTTTLLNTFTGAKEMNADLTGWKVGKVISLFGTFDTGTFYKASKFTGTGLWSWDISKVKSMYNTFLSTTSLTTCNKRKIADAWKSSAVFVATTYDTEWAGEPWCIGAQLNGAQFKQASWDYVQDTSAATTKWGDIGDLDVSGVTDFSYAFSQYRNQAGKEMANGNPKAATFVGTTISKWDTASATTLDYTFWGANKMNADLTGWKVGKVVSLVYTFMSASKFTGTGLWSWDVAKVTDMGSTFHATTSLTTCNKRQIADAWKSSAVFVATTYDTDWAADTCPVRPLN